MRSVFEVNSRDEVGGPTIREPGLHSAGAECSLSASTDIRSAVYEHLNGGSSGLVGTEEGERWSPMRTEGLPAFADSPGG